MEYLLLNFCHTLSELASKLNTIASSLELPHQNQYAFILHQKISQYVLNKGSTQIFNPPTPKLADSSEVLCTLWIQQTSVQQQAEVSKRPSIFPKSPTAKMKAVVLVKPLKRTQTWLQVSGPPCPSTDLWQSLPQNATRAEPDVWASISRMSCTSCLAPRAAVLQPSPDPHMSPPNPPIQASTKGMEGE